MSFYAEYVLFAARTTSIKSKDCVFFMYLLYLYSLYFRINDLMFVFISNEIDLKFELCGFLQANELHVYNVIISGVRVWWCNLWNLLYFLLQYFSYWSRSRAITFRQIQYCLWMKCLFGKFIFAWFNWTKSLLMHGREWNSSGVQDYPSFENIYCISGIQMV